MKYMLSYNVDYLFQDLGEFPILFIDNSIIDNMLSSVLASLSHLLELPWIC